MSTQSETLDSGGAGTVGTGPSSGSGVRGGFDRKTRGQRAEQEDAGMVVELLDEDGMPMVWFDHDGTERHMSVTVAGSHGERYRRAMEAQTTKTVRRKGVQVTGGLLNQQRTEVLARCVLAWQGFHDGGRTMECTFDNVLDILTSEADLREQVDAALDDHAGFTKPNSKG